MLDKKRIERIAGIKRRVVDCFDAGDWEILASFLGDRGGLIMKHQRLLRSLNFGDPDYPACVGEVIAKLAADEDTLQLIESMLSQKTDDSGEADVEMSVVHNAGPDQGGINFSRATAMMPFSSSFSDIRATIRKACASNGLVLEAADDIWKDSILINDIFHLIRTSCIVIVDFTGKNPNVMYETGVAHALNKEVIPISQFLDDVPFDLKHHRILIYENNEQGRKELQSKLENRIKTILETNGWQPFVF